MSGEKKLRIMGAVVTLIAVWLFARYFLIGTSYTSNGKILACEFGFLLMNLLALFVLLRSRASAYQWIWFAIGAGLQLWYLLFHMYPPNKIYQEGDCDGVGCMTNAWFAIDSLSLATLALTVTLGSIRKLRTTQIVAMLAGFAAIIMVFLHLPYNDILNGEIIFLSAPTTGDEGLICGPLWLLMTIALSAILVNLTTAILAFREETAPPRRIAVYQVLLPLLLLSLPSFSYIAYTHHNLANYLLNRISSLLWLCLPLGLAIILALLPKDGRAYRRITLMMVGAEIFYLIPLLAVLILILVFIVPNDATFFNHWLSILLTLVNIAFLSIIPTIFPKGSRIYQRIAFWIGFIFEICCLITMGLDTITYGSVYCLSWATFIPTLIFGWNGVKRRKEDIPMARVQNEPN